LTERHFGYTTTQLDNSYQTVKPTFTFCWPWISIQSCTKKKQLDI